ncbi:MAG: hypothetical protein ABJD24_12540 [Acidimicrobiales bacterium]
MAFAIPALANTNTPIAQTGGAVVVIPLMGSPLTVTVALDTTSGAITSVDLTPPTDFTATKLSPSRVSFEKGTDGTTRLNIRAKGDQLSVNVRTLKLDDLLGSGTWSGDVFGTGTKTDVPYTIGKDANGDPTIAIGTVTPPAPIVAEVGAAKTGSHDDDDDDGAWASQSVKFTNDGFTVRLTIRVSVDNDDESAGEAKLRFTLTGRDIQRLTLAELVGDHTWTGTLCDGTAASFTYTVNADGTLTAGPVVPADADVKPGSPKAKHEGSTNHSFLTARFSTKDWVRISLFVKGTDAALGTKVHDGHCGPPAADPTVNTPVSLKPNKDHGDGNGNNGKHGKDD